MKTKKHLGQHFLRSPKTLDAMIESARITPKDTVLEIGPGEGVLTEKLLETGARVIAVEMDDDLIPVLQETFQEALDSGQLTLIHGDVLTTPITAIIETSYKLVANIPYYITGEILRRFLSHSTPPTDMTLLIQKEVAERIARSKKETVLSLSVKAYGFPRYISTVPARYFSPPPKVDSAVLHVSDISKSLFERENIIEERFFKVIKAGFSSKRKQLINNLSPFDTKQSLERIFTQIGLRTDVRGEDVSLAQWCDIIRAL